MLKKQKTTTDKNNENILTNEINIIHIIDFIGILVSI